MTGPSKRRRDTATRIQAAAIKLAEQDGMANLTTEAISREAGVSPRTFFNYYPYKEAAIYGPPKDYPRDASENFMQGKGPLIDDLAELMEAHLSRFTSQRAMLGAMIRLADTDVKLAALQQSALLERHSQMEQMLRQRLDDKDPRIAPILASAIISATRQAILDWIDDRTDDLVGKAVENIRLIATMAQLLDRKKSS